jgi:hypothetical protein
LHVKQWVNGVGAATTATALIVILAAKFVEGAWITVLAIPLLLTVFRLIHRHYASIQQQIKSTDALDVRPQEPPVVIVPIQHWNRLAAKSLRFGMMLSSEVIGIHLSNLEGDAADDEAAQVRREWAERVEAPARGAGLAPPALELVRTPYREFVRPLLEQINKIEHRYPGRLVAVIVPEIVEKHWWYALLHSRRASQLRSALRARQDFCVIVIELSWFIKE